MESYKARLACVASLKAVNPRKHTAHRFEITMKLVTTSDQEMEVKALINSGTDISYISYGLVRWKLDWCMPKEPTTIIKCLNGMESPLFGNHTSSMKATDSNRVEKQYKHSFTTIDMVGVDVVLGYKWLEQINPHINWIDKMWHYHFKPKNLEVISLGCFLNTVQKGGDAYVTTPTLLANPSDELPEWV